MSIRAMADHLGYSHGSGYQYWEQGAGAEREHLPTDLIDKMGELVGTGDPQISDAQINDLFPRVQPRTVPLREWENLESADTKDFLSLPPSHPEAFALKVNDRALSRIAAPGSFLIVDPTATSLVPGRCYLIRHKSKTCCRIYYDNPRRFEADSLDRYRTIFFADQDENISVIGRITFAVTEL